MREDFVLARSLVGRGHRRGTVVVVGAGFSGLACAERLLRLGHEVVVLEARDRPGGRARTLRSPLAIGLHADLGGCRFHDYDARMRRYVRRFDLPYEPFYPPSGGMLAFLDGIRVIRPKGAVPERLCARELTPEERWIFAQETESQLYKIASGVDRVSALLAERLAPRVRYNMPVVRIEQKPDAVRVVCLAGGERETVAAARVVCAVPFGVLARIEMSPSLSPAKKQLIEALPYESATQIVLQLSGRPWEAEGLTGFAVTDTIGEVWHPTYDQPGPRAVLIAYTKGDLSRSLKPLSDESRVRAAVDAIDQVYPGARAHVEMGVATCWDEDEWAGGANAKPWDLAGVTAAQLRAPEGRIHFAGEHTSVDAPGWMEGAIEAGYQAADEVSHLPA